jgi:hypothetical protein
MATFDDLARSSVLAACREWDYPPPGEAWFETLNARLPRGIRSLFAEGVDAGLLLIVNEFRFTMRDLPPGKGPYALYGKSELELPAPHWEYFVQAVDYVRVRQSLAPKGYLIGVEDNLMDVTVRRSDGELLWYIESKEKSTELEKLMATVRAWGRNGVDFGHDDRGKDGLRKAKYLLKNRPPYFSGSAIGIRLDFSVSYIGDNRFELIEDAVPYV